MAEPGDVSEQDHDAPRYIYIFQDPETQGTYKVVARTSKSQDEVNAVVASVIEDEGRVEPSKTRTIYL